MTAPIESDWPEASPGDVGLDASQVELAMDELREFTGELGTTRTLLIRDGKLVWQGEDIDHPLHLWSCTKSFMSVCLGLLWDDGLLEPGDLAWKHYAELKPLYPAVTLEHLATFTSGYAHDGEAPTNIAAPRYAPGEALHYSHESDLLAAILTRLAGRPLADLFFERIGEAIGLTPDTMFWGTFDGPDGPVHGGAGRPGIGVRLSARNFARFGWFACNRGECDGRQLLSRRYFDYATVARTSTATPPHDPEGWYVQLPGNYGLNWWTNGPRPSGGLLWPSAPKCTFASQGNNNNLCLVVPEWRMVLVRCGDDKIIDLHHYDRAIRHLAKAGA